METNRNSASAATNDTKNLFHDDRAENYLASGFHQENPEDAGARDRNCLGKGEEPDAMTKLSELEKDWAKRPGFKKAYDSLEEEFALMDLVVRARNAAGLTQAQLARKMRTTQSVIARLESGKAKPSTRTLQKLAAATGHRLKLTLEPVSGQRR